MEQPLGETLVNLILVYRGKAEKVVQILMSSYLIGKYGGGSVNMWNGTAQTDQESLGSSSQRQSNPPHSSKHPPQPMQPAAQDKSSGKLKCARGKEDVSVTSEDASSNSCSCI